MKRLVKLGVASLAAAVVLFAAYHHVRAQEKRPNNLMSAAPANVEAQTSEAAVAGIPHSLLATYINSGNLDGESEAGTEFLALDSLTSIRCPNHAGCTLEVEENVELGGSTAAGNGFNIFPLIDGAPPGASYITSAGQTLPDGGLAVTTCVSTYSITYGTHTIQTSVVSTYGMNVGHYNNSYRVYAP